MSGPSHDKITIRGMVLPAGARKTPAVRRLRPELFPVVSRSGAFERSACVLVHHNGQSIVCFGTLLMALESTCPYSDPSVLITSHNLTDTATHKNGEKPAKRAYLN